MVENGLQNGQILISRLNVANSEICENGVTRKIPHEDFEKLAGMCMVTTCIPSDDT
jgi:hypothetical protein